MKLGPIIFTIMLIFFLFIPSFSFAQVDPLLSPIPLSQDSSTSGQLTTPTPSVDPSVTPSPTTSPTPKPVISHMDNPPSVKSIVQIVPQDIPPSPTSMPLSPTPNPHRVVLKPQIIKGPLPLDYSVDPGVYTTFGLTPTQTLYGLAIGTGLIFLGVFIRAKSFGFSRRHSLSHIAVSLRSFLF